MRHSTCNMQHATCNMQHATCNMPPCWVRPRRMLRQEWPRGLEERELRPLDMSGDGWGDGQVAGRRTHGRSKRTTGSSLQRATACCMLHGMLHVACCMLYVGCCMSHNEEGCMLHVAFCMFYVACCMLQIPCCISMSHVACCLSHVACCMMHVACCMLHVVCRHATG